MEIRKYSGPGNMRKLKLKFPPMWLQTGQLKPALKWIGSLRNPRQGELFDSRYLSPSYISDNLYPWGRSGEILDK
jgi:hypothetical protein